MASEKKKASSDNGDSKEQNILEKAKEALGIQPEQQTLFYTVAGMAGAVLLFFILMIVGFSSASGWKGKYVGLDSGDTAEKLTTARSDLEKAGDDIRGLESQLTAKEDELADVRQEEADKFRTEREQLEKEREKAVGQRTQLQMALAKQKEKSEIDLARLKSSIEKARAKGDQKTSEARRLQRNLRNAERERDRFKKDWGRSKKFADDLAKELQDSKDAGKNLDAARKKVEALERENQRLSVLAGPVGTVGQPAGKLSAEEAKKKYNALRAQIGAKEQRDNHEGNINLIEGAITSLLGTKYGANASKLLTKQVYYATRKRYNKALADTKEMPVSDERINALKSALKEAEQIGKTSYTKKLEQAVVTQQNEKKARDLFDPVDARVKNNQTAYDANLEALDGIVKGVKGTSYAKKVKSLISKQQRAKKTKEKADAAAKKAQAAEVQP